MKVSELTPLDVGLDPRNDPRLKTMGLEPDDLNLVLEEMLEMNLDRTR